MPSDAGLLAHRPCRADRSLHPPRRGSSPAVLARLLGAVGLLVLAATVTITAATPTAAGADGPAARATTPAGGGGVRCEFWKDVPGGDVADLFAHADFPDRPATVTTADAFEFPEKNQDNWGVALRGYLSPPTTGAYTFWIACDDAGALFLSTDLTPDHRQEICSSAAWTAFRGWDQSPGQKSKPVRLVAGRRYYVEAFAKNAGGVGHLSVGWQLPDGTMERPIPGTRLAPATVPARRPPAVPTTVTLDPRSPRATTPGHHKFPLGATVSRGASSFPMSYLLYLPQGYDRTADQRPLFIFLCGNTHQGTNLDGILNEGPAMDLANSAALREQFPFIGLFPQPPDNTRWDTPGMAQAVVGLVDEVCRKYPRVDRERIYLSGLSMGGKGTWLVSQSAPDRFAAIAPISAVAVDPEHAGTVLKSVPAWIICGSDDGGFTEGSKLMARKLSASGAQVELTVVDHEGHGVWGRYYPDPSFYRKLLQFRRKPAPPGPARSE